VCADPATAEFAEQLAKLAAEIRPTEAPPGPYAPGQVEATGPPGHVELLRSYEVVVAAVFESDVDLLELVLQRLPSGSSGRPSFGSLAQSVDVAAATTADSEPSTLRVTYSSRGQNPEEATQYAVDDFNRTCSELALPSPANVSADAREINSQE
jgi:hypothetical protein